MEMLCGQIIVCMTVTSHNSLASFNSLRNRLSLKKRFHGLHGHRPVTLIVLDSLANSFLESKAYSGLHQREPGD